MFTEWLYNPSYYKNFALPWSGATVPQVGVAGGSPYTVRNQIAAIGVTSTPSASLINEFRFSFSRQPVLPQQNPDSLVNNSGVLQHLQGLNLPLAPPYEPVPDFGIGGGIGFGPPGWTNGLQMTEAFTLLDNVTKVIGKHTIKTGFMFRDDRTAYEDSFPISLSFGGGLTGNPAAGGVGGSGLAQFLLGATDQYSNAGYFHFPYTNNHTWSFYVQDDFRLSPRFTLNLGFRYDIYQWFRERHNAGAIFNFLGPNPQIPTRLGRLDYLGTQDHPDAVIFPALKNDIGPRINFAYAPFANQKTIIRGGIDLMATNALTDAFGAQNGGVGLPGYDQTEYYTQDATGQGLNSQAVTPAFILSKGAPNLLTPANPTQSNTQFIGGSLFSPTRPSHDAAVAVWNLQVQRELPANLMISVGYVGSKGSHLVGDQYRSFSYVRTALKLQYRQGLFAQVPTPADLVAAFGGSTSTSQQNLLVQFPQYPGGVTNVVSYDGSSSYNAFHLKVEKRPSHGLGVIIAYSVQKTIASQNLGGYFANLVLPSVVSRGSRVSQVSGGLSGSAFSHGGGGAQDRDNLAADRALAPDDIPQILNIAWTYELPFGPGKVFGGGASGIGRVLVQGWKISGNFNAQNGVPLQITGPCNNLTCRPNLIGDPSAGRSGKSRVQLENQWFNANAFEPVFGSDPAVLANLQNGTNLSRDEFWRFGTAGLRLGSARSPSFWNTDLVLLKDVRISESKYVEFRWELYNALNHQSLGLPNTGWCLPPNPDGSFDGIVRQFGCQFGRITNVQTDPRNMQFGLKFVF